LLLWGNSECGRLLLGSVDWRRHRARCDVGSFHGEKVMACGRNFGLGQIAMPSDYLQSLAVQVGGGSDFQMADEQATYDMMNLPVAALSPSDQLADLEALSPSFAAAIASIPASGGGGNPAPSTSLMEWLMVLGGLALVAVLLLGGKR
jgi:hypothetical protein